ncbi:hypothetical protein B0O80DRAFT_223991 [Mortierella sp. GBAus27b]|nr:hypothetical protein B0O80DRAFT_223991 [Mortierella sp. GBAus27b]
MHNPDVEQPQISIDLSLLNFSSILAKGFPFTPVCRISSSQQDVFDEVEAKVVHSGIPLIADQFQAHEQWNDKLFSFDFLSNKHGNDDIVCRDLKRCSDVKLTVSQYIATAHSSTAKNGHKDILLYANDLSCPPDWRSLLMDKILPTFLTAMGENDLNGISPELAAENLMAYIGQNGTWTPAHIDHCGAIGHNIMVCDDDGSSVWFMVSDKDMNKFEELCRSLGREPQYENSFLSVDDLSRAIFPIYVAEQKTGDLILIPSLSYHQVVNLGNATIKIAWNRITASSARRALETVLPRYKKINNPELFKIKSIVKNTLEAWTSLLDQQAENLPVSKEHFCQSF